MQIAVSLDQREAVEAVSSASTTFYPTEQCTSLSRWKRSSVLGSSAFYVALQIPPFYHLDSRSTFWIPVVPSGCRRSYRIWPRQRAPEPGRHERWTWLAQSRGIPMDKCHVPATISIARQSASPINLCRRQSVPPLICAAVNQCRSRGQRPTADSRSRQAVAASRSLLICLRPATSLFLAADRYSRYRKP